MLRYTSTMYSVRIALYVCGERQQTPEYLSGRKLEG